MTTRRTDPSKAPWETGSGKLASYIEACFPEIHVRECRRIRMGWETVVLDINGEYIFRFMNLQQRWPHQQAEIDRLRWLAPQITTTTIPKYEFVWLGDKRNPTKFAGYKKILGAPMTKAVIRSRHIERLGKELGLFASELHSIRPPKSPLFPEHKDDKRYWLNFFQKVRRLAYPFLDAGTRKKAERFWPRFIDHISKVRFAPLLIHSDLSGGNIIIDPSTGALNGVIDWGNAKVGDPARDFMGVFAMSPRLGEVALANYDLESSGFKERIDFYHIAEAFEDIVIGSLESEERFRRRFIGEGLRHIGKRLL